MPLFSLTKRAVEDLLEIGRYTQKHWGKQQRDIYLALLDACFQQIAVDPSTGTNCNIIRSGYRKMSAGSHVIFYRQKQNNAIEIVRVLHGRMDFENRLNED